MDYNLEILYILGIEMDIIEYLARLHDARLEQKSANSISGDLDSLLIRLKRAIMELHAQMHEELIAKHYNIEEV